MAIVPQSSASVLSSAAETAGAAQVTTLLGRGSEFEGKLSFEGTVRVDGKISGEISGGNVASSFSAKSSTASCR